MGGHSVLIYVHFCHLQFKYLDDVVSTWILATKKHQTPEHTTKGAHGDTDLHYFLDMDMSVLGRPDQGKVTGGGYSEIFIHT